MSPKLISRNRKLLLAYVALAMCYICPEVGLAFNSSDFVLGLPTSVAWLTLCFDSQSLLTVLGYRWVLIPWSEATDVSPERTQNEENQL